MRAEQRKLRYLAVIKRRVSPAGWVVTIPAGCAQSAGVHVFISVAARTGAAGIVEARRSVTLHTGQRGVLTEQRKSGQTMIEHHLRVEISLSVTSIARACQLSGVRIRMTISTRRARRACRCIEMTVAASKLRVRTEQSEAGVGAVVEPALRPRLLAVTGLAGAAEGAAVRIVFRVACATAGARQSAKRPAAVASVAAQICVPAAQRKSGPHMMIKRGLYPAAGRMTLVTRLAKATAVHVVIRVAAGTLRGGFSEGRVRMTSVT